LLPFPAWETGNVSLFFFPTPFCSHLRDNLLLVCWKHIPLMIHFTVKLLLNLCILLEFFSCCMQELR
jgi:hypothetical protein